MDKELIEKLRDFLRYHGTFRSRQLVNKIDGFLREEGYVIIKKEDLIKKAGLIVAEELGVK